MNEGQKWFFGEYTSAYFQCYVQKQATRFSTFLRLLWESEIIVAFSQKLFSRLH